MYDYVAFIGVLRRSWEVEPIYTDEVQLHYVEIRLRFWGVIVCPFMYDHVDFTTGVESVLDLKKVGC